MVIVPVLITLALGINSFFFPKSGPLRVESIELKTGYALARNNRSQPTGFQYAPGLISAAIPMTDEQGSGWWRGRAVWNPELLIGAFTHPYHRGMVGLTPLQMRWEFAPRGRWTPYFHTGVGGVYARINNRVETGKDLNFLIGLGAGFRYAMSERASLLLEYRHFHISNWDTDEYNSGIDAHTVLAGVSLKS